MAEKTLGLVLSGTLIIQLLFVAFRAHGPVEVPIEVGSELPFAAADWSSIIDPTQGRSSCHVGFVCTTTCPVCSSLAARYSETIRSSTPEHLRPVWFMIPSDSPSVTTWAEEHSLYRVIELSPQSRSWLERPVVGDIWFTPTRLVLTSELDVRDARPADRLLDAPALEQLCDEGGISPRSAEEYRDLVMDNDP